MNTIVERLPECRATIRVELPAEVVSKERQSLTGMYAQQASIPGFRKGKVPKHVIEKRFGKQIQEELQSRLVNQGCQEGIKQENLDVLRITDVQEPEFHMDDTFSFTAELMLAPEVALPEYKEIPVEIHKVDVTDHDVEHHLDQVRQRMAEYQDIEGRGAEMGDIAVLTYDGSIDGEPLENVSENLGYLAKGENQPFRMDEAAFVTGFCGEIVGLEKGDKKEFDLELDDEFPVEELRGRTLSYKVELKELQEQVLPELNDELAAKMKEGMTLEELKEEAREEIKRQQEQAQKEETTTQILQYLDEKIGKVELPQDIVANETQRQVNDIVYRSQMQGVPQEKLQEQQDDIVNHASQQAEVNIKTGFILEQISEAEKIQAEENEMLMWIAQAAQRENKSMDKYMKELRKNDGLQQVANQIRTSKTLDFLRANASVTELDRPEHDHDHDH